MDAQARKKALYRAKLKNFEEKKVKRIESPLVRYNENDQPVCRVCDVILKSESLWDAHQASRKHHEAIKNIKANAAGLNRANVAKSESLTILSKATSEPSKELQKPQVSSGLPADFFDNHVKKKQKSGNDAVKFLDPDSHKMDGSASAQTQSMEPLDSKNQVDGLASSNSVNMEKSGNRHGRDLNQTSGKTVVGSLTKEVKGTLPEGFFDNKDADLRARGIVPVKPDVKDEYKEFEKLIQEDLKEVDNRLEEEEFDAAEMIEEAESVEQKVYWEKVETLKKKKLELKVARSSKRRKEDREEEKFHSLQHPPDGDSSSDPPLSANEIFRKIMGEDRHGRFRMYGHEVTSIMLYCPTQRSLKQYNETFKEELTQQITLKIKEELKQEMREELKQEIRDEIKQELKQEMRQEMREEMMALMRTTTQNGA